jgi:hypothetical protein
MGHTGYALRPLPAGNPPTTSEFLRWWDRIIEMNKTQKYPSAQWVEQLFCQFVRSLNQDCLIEDLKWLRNADYTDNRQRALVSIERELANRYDRSTLLRPSQRPTDEHDTLLRAASDAGLTRPDELLRASDEH